MTWTWVWETRTEGGNGPDADCGCRRWGEEEQKDKPEKEARGRQAGRHGRERMWMDRVAGLAGGEGEGEAIRKGESASECFWGVTN